LAARAYQEQERAKEKFEISSRKVISNELEEDKIYLKSLVLVRHLKFGA
jgi:hypothetical protein